MRRAEGRACRSNAMFSAARKQCAKQFCKRFYNFKFESVESARCDCKINGVIDFLEIEKGRRRDYRMEFCRECFNAKQPAGNRYNTSKPGSFREGSFSNVLTEKV